MGPGSSRSSPEPIDTSSWYRAPADPDTGAMSDQSGRPDWADLRALLWSWEKLRVLYNAILAMEVLVVTVAVHPRALTSPSFYAAMVVCCLGANACFFCGPLADAYARWFGLRHRAVMIGLFLAGMILAMALAGSVTIFGIPTLS